MVASTTSFKSSCSYCKNTLESEGNLRPHRVCCDLVHEKCLPKIFSRQESPEFEQEDGENLKSWECTFCHVRPKGSSGIDIPIIACLKKINSLRDNTLPAASTADFEISCQQCRLPLELTGDHRPYRTCHDLIGERCLPDTPEERDCTKCLVPLEGSSRLDRHIIDHLKEIQRLSQKPQPAKEAQRSHAASSSAASSSRDTGYDPSVYDAVKTPSAPLSNRDKANNFIRDVTCSMNLHGLTVEALNALIKEDRGLVNLILKKIHENLHQYHNDQKGLAEKHNPRGEPYKKYLAMVLLAANQNAIDASDPNNKDDIMNLARFYHAYACELGLCGADQQSRAVRLYQSMLNISMVSYNACCRLAFIFFKDYVSRTDPGSTSSASSDRFTQILPYLSKAREARSLTNVFNLSAPDDTFSEILSSYSIDISSYHSMMDELLSSFPASSTSAARPPRRSDDALFVRLDFLAKVIKKTVDQFDLVQMIKLANQGNASATCALAEYLLTREGSLKLKSVKTPLKASIITLLQNHADTDHHLKATILLGFYHLNGSHGLPKDNLKAINYFTIGSSKGNGWCAYWLAQLLKSNDTQRESVISFFKLALSRGIGCQEEARRYSDFGTKGPISIKRPSEYYFYV